MLVPESQVCDSLEDLHAFETASAAFINAQCESNGEILLGCMYRTAAGGGQLTNLALRLLLPIQMKEPRAVVGIPDNHNVLHFWQLSEHGVHKIDERSLSGELDIHTVCENTMVNKIAVCVARRGARGHSRSAIEKDFKAHPAMP